MKVYDLIIVGSGAAGLGCAIFAKDMGIENILLIEKDPILGGSLTIGDYSLSKSNSFTGKVYREKIVKEFNELGIETYLNTMVLKVIGDREVICTSKERGIEAIRGKAIILANGGKDKGKSLNIVGDRCSGIFTIGMAEKILEMDNVSIGKDIIIYGNENIYKIFNKLKKKNINIKGIICDKISDEILNLSDNLYLNYKVTEIIGDGRVEKIKIEKQNEKRYIKCDTLILANEMVPDSIVGMRSGLKLNKDTNNGIEIDKNFMTSKEGIFACGNGVYIHSSLDGIISECKKTVESVRNFINRER